MEKLKWVLDIGNRVASFIIDGAVVQVPMDLEYVYEDVNGKDVTDSEDFMSAALAAVPSGQSEEEEKGTGEELVLMLSESVGKLASEDDPDDDLDPPLAHLHRKKAKQNQGNVEKEQNSSEVAL